MNKEKTKAKEEAKRLIEIFKDYVHGYIGSSMLSNYEYPDQIIKQAKKCALISVSEKEKTLLSAIGDSKEMWTCFQKSLYDELQNAKKEIENYEGD